MATDLGKFTGYFRELGILDDDEALTYLAAALPSESAAAKKRRRKENAAMVAGAVALGAVLGGGVGMVKAVAPVWVAVTDRRVVLAQKRDGLIWRGNKKIGTIYLNVPRPEVQAEPQKGKKLALVVAEDGSGVVDLNFGIRDIRRGSAEGALHAINA